MKTKLFTCIMVIFLSHNLEAQVAVGANPENWTVFNRNVSFENEIIHLDAQGGDGVLWLNGSQFKNGTIELDLKGTNTPGQSFIGLAFHGKDNKTFESVYFRPFNFQNPERNEHSVQYISMPQNDWQILRKTFPGKFENKIGPVPEPVDDWFHVKLELDYPQINVYINGSEKPTLAVGQLSDRNNGMIGLWVGNGSEGWFRNLRLTERK